MRDEASAEGALKGQIRRKVQFCRAAGARPAPKDRDLSLPDSHANRDRGLRLLTKRHLIVFAFWRFFRTPGGGVPHLPHRTRKKIGHDSKRARALSGTPNASSRGRLPVLSPGDHAETRSRGGEPRPPPPARSATGMEPAASFGSRDDTDTDRGFSAAPRLRVVSLIGPARAALRAAPDSPAAIRPSCRNRPRKLWPAGPWWRRVRDGRDRPNRSSSG